MNGHIYYLACKLLWNPGADSDKILDDFYKNMYGSAADDMKKYYDNYEKAFIDSAEHVANQTPLQQIGTIFTPAVMKKAEKHLADARKKQQDNFIMDRIEKQEIAYGYILRLVQAIQSAMEIIANSDQFWLFDPAGNNPKLHDKYNVCFSELASYIDKYQSENIFYGTGNNYHTKMINKTNMLNYAESDLAKASKGLDKKEYLASTKQTITKPDTTTEAFDIWMYGNDWDSGENDGQTYEHFVYIIDPAGKRIEIGALGNLGDANADKVNRINIISNVSKNIIKACLDKNKDIKFLITNPSGAWTMSTFFAAYIMPPINKINNDYATWLVQKKVDWVRQASFGFRELSYQGEMLGENKEYEFLIPVTGRETAVPAMPVFFKE
ncbi:MAG: hypothetical protein A2096_08375 [Spirochaetes bacterium GWF1_41_5]|nr:MAG: hypothetical protein A2096_08375 [Spirochaetes bacterium GWF1_41_5]